MIIKNAKIYTPRHTFEEGDLFIRNGRIVPFAQPEEGEEVADDGIRFVVTKVDKNRIDRVKIILPKEEKEEETA